MAQLVLPELEVDRRPHAILTKMHIIMLTQYRDNTFQNEVNAQDIENEPRQASDYNQPINLLEQNLQSLLNKRGGVVIDRSLEDMLKKDTNIMSDEELLGMWNSLQALLNGMLVNPATMAKGRTGKRTGKRRGKRTGKRTGKTRGKH
jgi:hypothetical protein